MLLRIFGVLCYCWAISCVQVKVENVESDKRVVLRCVDNRTVVDENQTHCNLKSTRCLLSGYKLERKVEIYHPKAAYYIACLIFDKTTINMLPPEFFTAYSTVKYINLSFSKLHKIADFTFGLPHLVDINLKGNELISLSANVFNGAVSLETIDLSHNMISIVQPETFMNLRSLRDLNLSFNQLNNNSFNRNGIDWIDGIESLKSLDLSNNQIFYYDVMPYQAFSGLVNLETLLLKSNMITIDYGAFASNHKLKTLDLSNNNMTYFDLNFLLSIDSLENLFLNGNGISYASQIDLSDVRAVFPRFRSLAISENSFSCEVLSVIIKKLVLASIELVFEDGKFVNNKRNLRGVSCI